MKEEPGEIWALFLRWFDEWLLHYGFTHYNCSR